MMITVKHRHGLFAVWNAQGLFCFYFYHFF